MYIIYASTVRTDLNIYTHTTKKKLKFPNKVDPLCSPKYIYIPTIYHEIRIHIYIYLYILYIIRCRLFSAYENRLITHKEPSPCIYYIIPYTQSLLRQRVRRRRFGGEWRTRCTLLYMCVCAVRVVPRAHPFSSSRD